VSDTTEKSSIIHFIVFLLFGYSSLMLIAQLYVFYACCHS